MIIPASTNTTIATCTQIHVGGMAVLKVTPGDPAPLT